MEEKRLEAVAPANLATVWPQLREEAMSIETPDGFLPEDVYAMAKSGAATLFLLYVGEKRVGFMTVRLIAPDLHIWQLKAENGYDVMHTFREQLMQLARDAGAINITYGSTRKAWAKVAQEHGFKMRMIVYECPVDPLPTTDQQS